MSSDSVLEVGIDGKGSLYVKPASAEFPYIYREAMEVHWDANRGVLFGPPPRKWSYVDWYRQILSAAKTQGHLLQVTDDTRWSNIPDPLIQEMKAVRAEAIEV
jgi:hypothetical protein